MPETSDLQHAFDDLARDVTRVAGPGDVDRPIRDARRRRMVAGAASLALVAAVGVVATQFTVGDVRTDPGYVDTHPDPAPGAERRERLLRLIPPAKLQLVNLVDVVGFTGEPGLSLADEQDRQLLDYLNTAFITLRAEPFVSLVLPDLVSYAGTGDTSLFLLDRPAREVTGELLRAGWQDEGDGVLVPGESTSRMDRRFAPYVKVTEEGALTLVGISRDRDELPGRASGASTLDAAAARLLDLGGALGVSLGYDLGPCAMLTASLSSPTSATVLLRPPAGTAPEEVTTDDLDVPDAFEQITAVEPDGDLVRAEVAIEDAEAPLELLRRLGLPGTTFC